MTGVARGAMIFGAALVLSGIMRGTGLAEQTGMVYGRIYADVSHRAAAGVTVRLISAREPMQETKTRADGSFTFVAVFPGDATIEVGRSNAPVYVSAGLESDAMIVLTPDAIAEH